MKVPQTFVKEKNKEATQEQIEELIKKTLVDKILVENIAKEIKNYLESEILAKIFNIVFKKSIDIKGTNLDVIIREELYPSKENPEQIRNHIEVRYETKSSLMKQEATQILGKIIESEPGIKEEEIIQKNNPGFSILSKEVIYELLLNYYTNRELVETGKTKLYKKTNKKTIGTFFKKDFVKEETVELPIVEMYHSFEISGVIKYVKFNHEHNAKVMKVLKDLGYNTQVNIIEDKCKK